MSVAKKFDGRVWHAHCDTYLETPTLTVDFPADRNFGLFTPDLFLVCSSADLLAQIQEQLRKALHSSYATESIFIQLGSSSGELGSEMISANLASRLTQQINQVRQRAYETFKVHDASAPTISDTSIHPTVAGLRIYLKLPVERGNREATNIKIKELAIKYGAIPAEDGTVRDVSELDTTFKVNIFGFYNSAFYLNYKLVAPFRHKDKSEILAEQPKKSRKRAPSSTPAPPRKRAVPVHSEDVGANSEDVAAASVRAPGTSRKAKVATRDPSSINVDDYSDEESLATAYIHAGMPIRDAMALAASKKSGASSENGAGGGGSIFDGSSDSV